MYFGLRFRAWKAERDLGRQELSIKGMFVREYCRKITEGTLEPDSMVEDYERMIEAVREDCLSTDGHTPTREDAAYILFTTMSYMRPDPSVRNLQMTESA